MSAMIRIQSVKNDIKVLTYPKLKNRRKASNVKCSIDDKEVIQSCRRSVIKTMSATFLSNLFLWSQPCTGVFNSTSIAIAAAAEEKGKDCEYITTKNGIQYCDVIIGTGEVPNKGDLIRANYTGKLASNGKVFDSSFKRGFPLIFKIGIREVIAGWDIGILGNEEIPPMKAGGFRKLRIPPEYAYGERGAGRGLIPPNATLDFDVEYLGLK